MKKKLNGNMMIERGVSDFEELVLKCISKQGKMYIQESIKCYKAGAYRASIVNSWIALVFDLIDKIRELTLSGDGTAKSLLQKFENFQEQIQRGNNQALTSALEFEREIIQTVNQNLEFFNAQELVDLERLRKDRHRCAHPSFNEFDEPYIPSAEQARIHIRNVIEYVLSQPPVQGKSAINSVIQQISSSYFPKERDKAYEQLINSPLKNAKQSLQRGVVDTLLFSYFDSSHKLYFNSNVITALQALLNIDYQLVWDRIMIQLEKIFSNVDDEDFSSFLLLSIKLDNILSSLSQSVTDKANRYITTAPVENLFNIFEYSNANKLLQESSKDRLKSLDAKSLNKVLKISKPDECILNSAVNIYISSGTWDEANTNYQLVISPLINFLEEKHIKVIFMAASDGSADLKGSHGFDELLDLLIVREIVDNKRLGELKKKYSI